MCPGRAGHWARQALSACTGSVLLRRPGTPLIDGKEETRVRHLRRTAPQAEAEFAEPRAAPRAGGARRICPAERYGLASYTTLPPTIVSIGLMSLISSAGTVR